MINILSKPDHLNYENFYHFFVIAHRSEGAQEAAVKAQFQEKKMLHTEEERRGTKQISHRDNAREKPVKRSLYSTERKKKMVSLEVYTQQKFTSKG